MTVSSALLRAARSCLSSPSLDRGVALSLTERVDAVTHLIASLEFLAAEQDRRPGGVNDWEPRPEIGPWCWSAIPWAGIWR